MDIIVMIPKEAEFGISENNNNFFISAKNNIDPNSPEADTSNTTYIVDDNNNYIVDDNDRYIVL